MKDICNKNQTLLIVKHHIIEKNYQWKLLETLSKKFLIYLVKKVYFDINFYREFYSHLKKFDFYDRICTTYSKGYVLVVYINGNYDVIEELRKYIGKTNPEDCKRGQLRKKYGESTSNNAVHASEDFKSYLKEIKMIEDYENKT